MSDYYITEGEIADKMYNVDIEGMRISITLDGIDEKDHEWYCERFTSHLRNVADTAARKAELRLQLKMRNLLGVN